MTKTQKLREDINRRINYASKKGVPLTVICNESGINYQTFQRIRRGENTTTDNLHSIEKAINKLLRGL